MYTHIHTYIYIYMYIYIYSNIYTCTHPPTHLLTHTYKSKVLEDVCNHPFRTPSSTDCNRLQQTATDCTNLQKSAMHMQRRNPTLTHTNTRTPVIKHTNNRTDVINMFPFNTAFHIGGRFKNWNFPRFVPRCDWESGCLQFNPAAGVVDCKSCIYLYM